MIHIAIGRADDNMSIKALSFVQDRQVKRKAILYWPEVESSYPITNDEIIDRVLHFAGSHVNCLIITINEVVVLTFQSMIRNSLIPAASVAFYGVKDNVLMKIDHDMKGDFINYYGLIVQQWEMPFHLRFHNVVEDMPAYQKHKEQFSEQSKS